MTYITTTRTTRFEAGELEIEVTQIGHQAIYTIFKRHSITNTEMLHELDEKQLTDLYNLIDCVRITEKKEGDK